MTTGGCVERTLFRRFSTDELVHLLLFEVEELVVAARNRVDKLILHVELGHCEHCTQARIDAIYISYIKDYNFSR